MPALTPIPVALAQCLAAVRPLPRRTVPLAEAAGRVLAADVRAPHAHPVHTHSAMDGYAVVATDLQTADADRPVALPVTQDLPAGTVPTQPLLPGQVARVFTGAILPEGATAVVPQEDVVAAEGLAQFTQATTAGRFVRAAGADLQPQDTLARAGQRLDPATLGVLAAMGHATVPITRTPTVAIVPNGAELVPLGTRPGPGQIVDANGPLLTALCARSGATALRSDPVADDRDALRTALQQAAQRADLVLVVGGMSVGDHDHAAAILGEQAAFYKVASRPGKPLGLASLAGTPVLGLPGNPISAAVSFWLFGHPMIAALQGAAHPTLPRHTARLAGTARSLRTRTDHLRARLHHDETGQAWVTPHARQGSGDLSSLLSTDTLVVVPAGGTALAHGDVVEVVRLAP